MEVIDTPENWPDRSFEDTATRGQGPAADAVGVHAARPAALVIVGAAMAVAISVTVWLGFDALWSSVAGALREETVRYGRGLIHGSGSLASAFLFARPGIVSIPRNLRQIDLTDNFYRTFAVILLLLQFFDDMLWTWLPSS
ncbi:MAG: hypothetical protein M3457_18830 [Chloroflexota bacterium]|nr:hypothetical protein [Chloroflexota bacterium]